MGAFGAIIMAFFGAVFAALTLRWQAHAPALMQLLPFLVFALIGIAAVAVLWMPGRGIVLSERAGRAIMWSTIAEGVGIFVAVNVVVNLHRPNLTLPAIALVVGLHFLPIAGAAAFPPFYVLGGLLIAAAMVGMVAGPPAGAILSGGAACLALWVAAVLAVVRDRQARHA